MNRIDPFLDDKDARQIRKLAIDIICEKIGDTVINTKKYTVEEILNSNLFNPTDYDYRIAKVISNLFTGSDYEARRAKLSNIVEFMFPREYRNDDLVDDDLCVYLYRKYWR